jgi:hypothetical protein
MHITPTASTSKGRGFGALPAIAPPAGASVINSLAFVRKKPARQRAQIAAYWVAGEYILKPTVTNATTIFAVNRAYVSAARNGGNSKPASCSVGPLVRAWTRASSAQRIAFAHAIGAEILFESAIAPALETANAKLNGVAIHST